MEDLKNLSPHFNDVKGNVYSAFSLDRLKISEDILAILIPVMNEIHGLNYSYRFWKIVLGDYINAVVSIKHVFEEKEMLAPVTLEAINSHHVPTFSQKASARIKAYVKHFKTKSNLQKTLGILKVENAVSLSLPDLEVVRKETGVALPLYYRIYPGKGNNRKRDKVNAIAKRYPAVYHKNIIQRLPKVYVEFFDYDSSAVPLSEPARKTFHVHGSPQHFYALLIARYVENGAKLYCYQHGAYYGELIGHNSYRNESSVADEYRTWGWTMQPKDVPWKAYRLEKFKRQYDTFPKTNSFDFLMCYPDVFSGNTPFYKTCTSYFLENIDPSKCNKLLARPRPMNKIFSHAKRLAFIKDERVTIDSGLGNMAQVISNCSMVIQFTVPATNFMECLYVDHPTVGLLDNDQPTAIIKPYYDYFIEKGLLHYNMVSLVAHLNNINIKDWWSEIIQDSMYLQYKHQFLRKV